MKKYKVVCKDSDKIKFENPFDAKVDAIEAMNEEIDRYNELHGLTEEEGLSPFDFTMDVVEVEDKKEDNGIEKDFEDAREELDSFKVTSDEAAKHFDSLAQLIKNANPRHIKALIALNKLFTIAEKWNKEDGFVPDFSNKGQWKYFPWFEYSKEAAGSSLRVQVMRLRLRVRMSVLGFASNRNRAPKSSERSMWICTMRSFC